MHQPLERPTVLVVDDDDSLRTFLHRVLEEHGYHVLVAASGFAALHSFNQLLDPPILLLTDIEMPGMTGPELADHVLKLHPAMKVLFMSGNGAAHCLAKPFDKAVLLRAVTRILTDDG